MRQCGGWLWHWTTAALRPSRRLGLAGAQCRDINIPTHTGCIARIPEGPLTSRATVGLKKRVALRRSKQEIKLKVDSKIADSKNDKNLKSEVKEAQDPTNTSKP